MAGRLYAISTAGSLMGTLVSALLLIPLVGARRTFLIFALVIAVVAVSGLRPVRRWALAPAAIAALMAIPVGTLKAEAGDGRVIYEKETRSQYARVVERSGGVRILELNEGQAQHWHYDPHTVLTGAYWDGYLVLPLSVRSAPPRTMAVLGNAAGTTSRAYGRFFPRTRIDGVEIDPELSHIGRRFFGMTNPRLRLHHEDARPWLRRSDERYDLIEVDAYRQPYIPFYLTTREFFESVRDHLTPDGVVIVNAGHPEGQQGLEKVLSATMGAVFPHVARDPIEPTNTLVLGSRLPPSAQRLSRAAARSPPMRPLARRSQGRLAPALRGGRLHRRPCARGMADRQVDRGYAAGAERGRSARPDAYHQGLVRAKSAHPDGHRRGWRDHFAAHRPRGRKRGLPAVREQAHVHSHLPRPGQGGRVVQAVERELDLERAGAGRTRSRRPSTTCASPPDPARPEASTATAGSLERPGTRPSTPSV